MNTSFTGNPKLPEIIKTIAIGLGALVVVFLAWDIATPKTTVIEETQEPVEVEEVVTETVETEEVKEPETVEIEEVITEPVEGPDTAEKITRAAVETSKTLGKGLIDVTQWGVDKVTELQKQGAFDPDNWSLTDSTN